MPKRSLPRRAEIWRQSDVIWAVVSILSFPTVALSLVALGWQSYTAFFMACLAMLAILLVEALSCGHVWIFHERYRHIFNHQETPFRIMIVSGGVLLILETFLVIQLFQSPSMDGFFLNIIARKQCLDNRQGSIADMICPLFRRPNAPVDHQDFALMYSLEDAAKKHLIPSSLAGSCEILPLNKPVENQNMEFFAYCRSWQATSCSAGHEGEAAVISAQLLPNDQGFFTPTVWQEDRQSEKFQSLANNKDLLQYLDRDLDHRCQDWMKQPVKPS